METRVCYSLLCVSVKPFKSYYVVWKRFFATKRARAVPVFKSYYVVWKQRFVGGKSDCGKV